MAKEPTEEERAAARRVLTYYRAQANRLAELTDQERPSEWAHGIETCIELLKDDPKVTMREYLEEYKAGH